ncbi:UNVERIFIED_CONTAM: hypothetical protein Slati_0499200 [Sesamum latifolium]|uniref:Uncharacterized protein n=1 Tax=Sesamum latifolium TaxID=2727402 RepID=A0AAW2XYG6_9LAMI
MASQGARADPVASREESWESTEGSIAPASAGGMEIDRESVGADAPIPPISAPVAWLPSKFAQILQMALQTQAQAQAQFLAQARQHQQFLQLIVIMKESERWELPNLRVP